MNYVRRLFIAIVVFAFITCAWAGAEIIFEGKVQQSIVDTIVAVFIALSISGKFEKGVEENERREKLAEEFAEKLIEHIKEREETKDGKDGSEQCLENRNAN